MSEPVIAAAATFVGVVLVCGVCPVLVIGRHIASFFLTASAIMGALAAALVYGIVVSAPK